MGELANAYKYLRISTHAPAGGATKLGADGKAALEGFLLTPLREGRRFENVNTNGTVEISTHAPAGGATAADELLIVCVCLISTHAPAGGATGQ